MDVLVRRTVVAQHSDALGQFVVVGRDGAGVAQTAQVLGGVEGEPRSVPEGSGSPSGGDSSVRLCRILDQGESVVVGDCLERVPVTQASVEVHSEDRPGGRRDVSLDRLRIEVERGRIGLDQDRGAAVGADGQDAGNVGVGRDDDLVPRAEPVPTDDQAERVQTTADAHAVPDAAESGELLFERGNLRPQNVLAGGADRLPGHVQFCPVRLVDCAHIEERDHVKPYCRAPRWKTPGSPSWRGARGTSHEGRCREAADCRCPRMCRRRP